MKKNKLVLWTIILSVIVLLSLAVGILGHMYHTVKEFENIFAANIYIEDINVGGLTKDEARKKLNQTKATLIEGQSLVITQDDIRVTIPFENLGLSYNVNQILDEAFALGHNEDLWEQYQIAKDGLSEPIYFDLTRHVDQARVADQLELHAESFYIKPIDALLSRKNKTFVITPEITGQSLDVNATAQDILSLLSNPNNLEVAELEVQATTIPVSAKYTSEVMQASQSLLSSFATSYNNASANRNENLQVASTKITRMIFPDEVFYLSNQLEPFTEAAGYKNAGTIVNGRIEDSLGGGICQVASTLYNAVLLTDLEIVKRQNHSLAVSYVPLGRDATYNTGTIDFQFKNNTGYPIFIEGYCENNQVIINIYGHQTAKSVYEIKFESNLIEVIPAPETKYEDDPSLDEGKEVVEVTALDGKRVQLYKLYYQNGSLVKKALVNNSYYRPRAAVIKRGTKPIQNMIEPPSTPEVSVPIESPNTPVDESTTSSMDLSDFTIIQG